MNQMKSTLPQQAARVVGQNKTEPVDLYEIAERSTYTAARYAPKDADALYASAEEAVDSLLLPRWYYESSYKTPQERRRCAIARAVLVAKRGAVLNMLPEVAWEAAFMLDGRIYWAAAALKAAVISSPQCEDWIDEMVTRDRVVVRVKRKGHSTYTTIDVKRDDYKSLHGRKNWTDFGTDMLYARAAGSACRKAFSDRCFGMYTKEEGVDIAIDARSPRAPAAEPTSVDEFFQVLAEQRAEAAPPIAPPPPADMAPAPEASLADSGELTRIASKTDIAELRRMASSYENGGAEEFLEAARARIAELGGTA